MVKFNRGFKFLKVIAGLGNPGDKYADTRHNIGFKVTGLLAEKHNIDGKYSKKFNSIIGNGVIEDNEILIIQPLTFMNLSGTAIEKILNWRGIPYEDLFVVFDDISLDLGRIRFRPDGSDGGHNGIKSIIESLGGFKDFERLKVGIGPQPPLIAREDFVLQKFAKDEKEIIDKIIPVCVEGIETFLKEGIVKARDKYNGYIFE